MQLKLAHEHVGAPKKNGFFFPEWLDAAINTRPISKKLA
jgi:hypothetical protein